MGWLGARAGESSTGRRPRRGFGAVGWAVVGAMFLTLAAPAARAAGAETFTDLSDGFSGLALGQRWSDGDRVGAHWRVVFAGYGSVSPIAEGGIRALRLAPAVAADPAQTHAGLVVSTGTTSAACQRLTARMRTAEQLRVNSAPNPWEAAWLVWGYSDNQHFYYLAVKPNGWELGKRDPAYPGGQRFLATGGPGTPIGRWRDVRIVQRGDVIQAWLDGQRVVRFRDQQRPYLTGSIGMYTEDAVGDWDSISSHAC